MAGVRGRGFGGVVIGALAGLAAATALGTEYPGAIPGGFSVSDQGAGQYSIPVPRTT
jgi:hypothetical protein